MKPRPRQARTLLVGVLLVAVALPASAGPYGDALGKCLVDSTTSAEKTTIVTWMFAMATLHPDVMKFSAVTPEQRARLSKEMGQLYERLVTQTCAPQAREAIRYEGEAPLASGFSLLGQEAARELFTHPKVSAGLSDFSKYVDGNKIKALAEPPTP